MRGGNAFGECTLSALVFFAVIMNTGVEGAAPQRTCPAGDSSCPSGKTDGELALQVASGGGAVIELPPRLTRALVIDGVVAARLLSTFGG